MVSTDPSDAKASEGGEGAAGSTGACGNSSEGRTGHASNTPFSWHSLLQSRSASRLNVLMSQKLTRCKAEATRARTSKCRVGFAEPLTWLGAGAGCSPAALPCQRSLPRQGAPHLAGRAQEEELLLAQLNAIGGGVTLLTSSGWFVWRVLQKSAFKRQISCSNCWEGRGRVAGALQLSVLS